jgi:transposase
LPRGAISGSTKSPDLRISVKIEITDMTQNDLNKWIMYHEIQKLFRWGFSAARIARHLNHDARTVRKYLNMTEQEYEQFLLQGCHRNKLLDPYEPFIVNKLSEFQDTPAAQIHDWLKEHHPDFPQVTPRTVYNFVMYVRQRHNIPLVPQYREYFPVEELPYGDQAQVDFGEYNMLLSNGKRKKVRFFAMVLSRSRMKFVWFSDKPFTAQIVVQAHEKAFEFFEGIPGTLVYDQDRTIIVEENIGDVILTSIFQQYTKTRNFRLHFCRKSDPESKGKIENVIQFVKKNFLYNRLYSDLENLNNQALGWLNRTANYLEHNYTKKSPQSEHVIEKEHLKPFTLLTILDKESKTYYVRKTNTISYKSNFYSLPSGTYQGSETQVTIKTDEETIYIYDLKNQLLCSHKLSHKKGQTIINTNHRRDTSDSLDEKIKKTAACFTDQSIALQYLDQIRKKLPRYTRDHLQVILKTLADNHRKTADETLAFCMKNNILNGHEFSEVYYVHLSKAQVAEIPKKIPLLDKNNLEKADQRPSTSNIEEYEKILNP